jgi:hypothetical protein
MAESRRIDDMVTHGCEQDELGARRKHEQRIAGRDDGG